MFVLNKNFGLVKTITLRRTILKTIYITVEIICLNKVLGLIKILLLSKTEIKHKPLMFGHLLKLLLKYYSMVL